MGDKLRPIKNIIVLSDGTWNGHYTNTNIKKLSVILKQFPKDERVIRYYEGVGNVSSFFGIFSSLIKSIFDAFFGSDLDDKVKIAYKYICREYDPNKENKIWLFGFSRGAYSVRALLGLINNCGLVKTEGHYLDTNNLFTLAIIAASILFRIPKLIYALLGYFHLIDGEILKLRSRKDLTFEQFIDNLYNYLASKDNLTIIDRFFGLIINKAYFEAENRVFTSLVNRAYDIYLNRSEDYSPNGDRALDFARSYSYPNTKSFPENYSKRIGDYKLNKDVSIFHFVGLFDTVGAYGIPQVSFSSGFQYPYLYDQYVPSSVKYIYHAIATHEYLQLFQYCPILQHQDNPNFEERWFPGIHLDIGGYLHSNDKNTATLKWMVANINRAVKDLHPDLNIIIPNNLDDVSDVSILIEYSVRTAYYGLGSLNNLAYILFGIYVPILFRPRIIVGLNKSVLFNDGEWAQFNGASSYLSPALTLFRETILEYGNPGDAPPEWN